MSALNKAIPSVYNHEGFKAKHITPEQQLRRSVMSCMLWEDEFYESGETISDRIRDLIPQVSPEFAAACAYSARTEMKLRHVPLLIVREMARIPTHRHLVGTLLPDVIQRADEITEFISIYWKDGKCPLSKQIKIGLAAAFNKFSEYDLAKYNRDNAIKLRDVLFLCHSKPADSNGRIYDRTARKHGDKPITEKEKLFAKLVNNKLETPDTWEVALSGGADKKATFERLIAEKKLGALAWLRNLRNMAEAGVDNTLIKSYSETVKVDRVLPFRFIVAARYVPQWEPYIETAMMRCLENQSKISGKTTLLIDTSPSMSVKLSGKSELTRKDAALGLAILLREICPEIEIVAFSQQAAIVAPRRGFALSDAIRLAVPSNGTLLGNAIRAVSGRYERLIVITDEESQDAVCDPDAGTLAYMINVASSKNGIGYGAWTHFDGWSESVIDYISESEKQQKG